VKSIIRGVLAHKPTIQWLAWGAWGLALVAISIRVWFKPGAHSVFVLFRDAGAHWVNGQNLYGQGSKFLYSPLTAAWFAPFSFLPENVAGIVWRLLGGLALALTAYTAGKTVWPRASESNKWSWGLLLLLPLALSNLNNGQTNPLVLALMLISIISILYKRWFLSAICIAVATYFKIYPLVIGLLLSVPFPRQLFWRLVLSLAGLFLLSLLLQRPSYVLGEYAHWFDHLGGITRRSAGESRLWRDVYFLLWTAHVPITPRIWLVVEALSGISIALFCAWGVQHQWQSTRLIFAAVALGCAWMVLFGPATDAASYLLLGPVLIYGLFQSLTTPLPSWIRIGMITSYAGLIGADICDSWLRVKYHFAYIRCLQPGVGLIFLTTIVAWLAADKYWSRHYAAQK
jgi:hypothetical protein